MPKLRVSTEAGQLQHHVRRTVRALPGNRQGRGGVIRGHVQGEHGAHAPLGSRVGQRGPDRSCGSATCVQATRAMLRDLRTKGRGATTIRRVHAVLRSALTSAKRARLVAYNAATDVGAADGAPGQGAAVGGR